MTNLITIQFLKDHIGHDDLLRLAGVGNFRDEDGRSLDETKINEAISFASELVNGYLAKRYDGFTDLDLDQIPNVIQTYAGDIAHYRLRLKSSDKNDVTKEVRTRYEDARSWLKDVSRGSINIDFADALPKGQGASSPHGKVMSSSPPARAQAILEGF